MSKGFPTGDGCFKMGYIKRPLKEPGNFTEEDYTQMSKGLTTVGLKCGDNTPEKMVRYVDDIRKSLPNPLPSELHAFMAAREGKHVVSSPDPPIPQRWMYYITSTRKEGLENIACFLCALEEFAQSQWGARCHMTDRRMSYHSRMIAC